MQDASELTRDLNPQPFETGNITLPPHEIPAYLAHFGSLRRANRLAQLVSPGSRTLANQQPLFNQGDRFDALYLVREGAMKTVMVDDGGTEQLSNFYFSGELMGLDGIHTFRHTTSAYALEPTRISRIPFCQLEQASCRLPDIQHQVFTLMAGEITYQQRMIAVMSRKNAEQRVAYLLLRCALHCRPARQPLRNFRLPMSRKDIGDNLGLAVETVSRILSLFEQRGVARFTGRRVERLNLQRLEQQYLCPP